MLGLRVRSRVVLRAGAGWVAGLGYMVLGCRARGLGWAFYHAYPFSNHAFSMKFVLNARVVKACVVKRQQWFRPRYLGMQGLGMCSCIIQPDR